MKFAYASDLHLEFSSTELLNEQGADVLLLAGDICLSKSLKSETSENYQRYTTFFDKVSKQFPQVYLVMGNHEHYKGDFAKSAIWLNQALERYPNLTLLDNTTKDLGSGILLTGCTLWTDFDRGNPYLLYTAKNVMNDYKGVKDTSHYSFKFLPKTAHLEHLKSKLYLQQVLKDNPSKSVVVMSHHAPHVRSLSENEKGKELSGLYYSDLTELLTSHDNLKTWVHGHTHNESNYQVGSVPVLCNPRGYNTKGDAFSVAYFEVT